MEKKAIITSALPYSNGEIHLGHVASTYLPADITTRFLRQKGVEAYYICASDDFGTPILIQSERQGITPQEYVRHWNKRDAEDFAALDIRFDLFYSTSSPENIEFAQYVFKALYNSGHIYGSEIIQPYCERDRKFLPDRYVKGTCPHCGAEEQYSDLCESCGRIPEEIVDPRCSICGHAPIKKASRHYFFRLKEFAGILDEWLDGNSNLQRDVKKYVKNWIRSGLIDWDITRDIDWGVPVPLDGADGKVMYGWFDNHLAYISTAVKFLNERGINGKEFWNSAEIYHFIGKDIVYHHYLFLPAIRLGLDSEYKLPDKIPTRGHLTLESRKISKSRNWYIGLREFLDAYPADYLRFYLTSINPYAQDDLNFDWEDFRMRINSELIGNIGNFINRALGFTQKRYGRKVPSPDTMRGDDRGASERITALADHAGSLMDGNHLDKALRVIQEFSARFNQYFQHSEPWKGDGRADTCVYFSVNAVRSMAIALYPFIPGSADRIWDQLNMTGTVSEQQWDTLSELAVEPGHAIGRPAPLFEKIEEANILSWKKRFGTGS